MVEKLDALLRARPSGLVYENIVVPDLLDRARSGGITEEIRETIREVLSSLPEEASNVLLCSCSTLGGLVEELGEAYPFSVLRIDRPMAERAVEIGRRIGLAAALESTIEPTRRLLESVAAEQGKTIEVRELLAASAWEHWLRGDETAYIDGVVRCLRERADGLDVIVLAQGSMAPAERCAAELGLPVLSSPTSAVVRVEELLSLRS